jgi:hypothetical protein
MHRCYGVDSALLSICVVVAAACGSSAAITNDATSSVETQTAEIQATEQQRLRSLVDVDLDLARAIHSDDFQLVNPLGRASSKEQYLSSVSSGVMDYVEWEPGVMVVRLYDRCAVVRYQSRAEMLIRGAPVAMRAWNMTLYEKQAGRWRAVWSQATEIK